MDIRTPSTSQDHRLDQGCLDHEVRCLIEGSSSGVPRQARAATAHPGTRHSLMPRANVRAVKLRGPSLAGLAMMRPAVGIATGVAR